MEDEKEGEEEEKENGCPFKSKYYLSREGEEEREEERRRRGESTDPFAWIAFIA